MAPLPPAFPTDPLAAAAAAPAGSADFSHRLRVYWEDTDAGGVVFYANYLKFFERARTEWLRALGFSQQVLREQTGAMFIVADTRVSYRAPARLDDELAVSVQLRHAGQASMLIFQQAWHVLDAQTPRLLAEGEIRIGCVDAGTFRPRRIPSPILHCLGPRAPAATA